MENQQQQTTEVTVVLSSELEAVVKENNSIELTKAQSHALAFAPSMDKVNELSKALATMNKENPSETEAKIARRCRLDLVPVRTGADKIKKELKAGILREEKLIDSLYGVIKNTSELIEAEYEKIEKFAENREKERKENLFTARKFLLDEYTDQASIYPLGDMDEVSFQELLDGLKLQKEAKEKALQEAEQARIEAEKQAEIDRIEAQRVADEKAEAQRLENIRLKEESKRIDCLISSGFSFDGNYYFVGDFKRLDKLTIFSLLESEFEEVVNAGKAEIARLNEKAENERKAEEEKQAKIQAQKDAELAKQKAEKEELEKQLKAKQDAELKADNERKEKEKAEAKRQKELLKAGDMAILNDWIDKFNIDPIEIKGLSKEAIAKSNEIFSKFQAFQKWAKTEAEKF